MQGALWRIALGAAVVAALVLAPAQRFAPRASRPGPRRAERAAGPGSRRDFAYWLEASLVSSPWRPGSQTREGRSAAEPGSATDLVSPTNPLSIAYAPPSPDGDSAGALIPLGLPLIGIGTTRDALADYASGDLAAGDALASQVSDPVARTALEWAALRGPQEVGFKRLVAFVSDHPHWPAAGWVRRRAEEALWRDDPSPQFVIDFFMSQAPRTAIGKLALARARLAQGQKDKAAALVRRVWREDELYPWLETTLYKNFGSLLSSADDADRASRLAYKGLWSAALRAAKPAGPDVLALVKARAAVARRQASDRLMEAVPLALRKDPGYLFARVQKLRRAGKYVAAAKALLGAPLDPAALVDGDAWWLETRTIARKLLDLGDAKLAYEICVHSAPTTPARAIDAQFHAGWIALRFLSDPKMAEPHFAALAALAKTPVSKARGDYWLGRTAQAQHSPRARAFFQEAAAFPTTYYGQLAQQELREPPAALAFPARMAQGDQRDLAVRVVEFLGALGQRPMALSLAVACAHKLTSQAQLAALAQIGVTENDARETLEVGKIAEARGFPLDNAAFPMFGVPSFTPLARSAPPDIVYAVARQESAFQTHALSSAGARGLMQMILSTARRTAEQFRVPFDPKRLTSDPAFNAQLGAAHLGELMRRQGGSLILTFAAYNAGETRVRQWMRAYGDPRKPGVDPVDWVERIPIAQTRDYVQRVMENFNVYKLRFARGGAPRVRSSPAPAPAPPVPPATDVMSTTPQARL